MGEAIATLPQKVGLGVVAGNVALQGILATGQHSGRLVLLSKESAAAMKSAGMGLRPGEAFSGVLRGGSGRIVKHLRFTNVGDLTAVASVGTALGALALQLQLQQIAKGLADVQRSIGTLEEHVVDELASGVESHFAELARAYRVPQDTGDVSDVEWVAITHHAEPVKQRVREVEKKLGRAIEALRRVGPAGRYRSASSRLEKLDRVEREHRPLLWLELYLKAQRATILGEYIRLYRFIATDNPHLDVHRGDSEQQLRLRVSEMIAVCDGFESPRVRGGARPSRDDRRRRGPQRHRGR